MDNDKKKKDPEGEEGPAEAKGEGDKEAEKKEEEETSKLGRFIQKYHTFLSSFVIGVAGLIATSIWQYRQSEVARRTADSQQHVAETQAENQWRIEKAEILSKNLQVLSAQTGNVEQRYGVLLSLARGSILDPELAVSYALELGKENPDYMQSVLANTAGKDYARLSRAFVMSCEQRYGIARNVGVCSTDRLSARSDAIAQLIADETQAAMSQGQPGPLVMLKDERDVQQNVQRLSALFWATLTDMYERRLWNELNRFQSYSPGARLVSALVLAAARTGEFVSTDEAKKLDAFHDQQTQWLSKYLMATGCDAECKGKIVEVMVSHYDESLGDYDAAMKKLLESPRAQSGNAVSRLHARLLWCQVHEVDLQPLRDNVLVPAAKEMYERPKPDQTTVDDLVGLMALVPEPAATEKQQLDAWRALLSALDKPGSRYGKVFRDRRATAQRERLAPPPAMKKVSFCGIPETVPAATE
ncbi:MAG: hypothetical protein JWN44_1806 [Myxococcales bacterium]|nr:hypothetical protein [Myxococcales bacterium]